MEVKTKNKSKIKKTDSKLIKNPKKINAVSIIVSLIIAFIFGYIIFDFFVIKKKIENEVLIVNQKFDSLQLYLDNKIPMIDNAIQIQEEQVKELQRMDSLYIIK